MSEKYIKIDDALNAVRKYRKAYERIPEVTTSIDAYMKDAYIPTYTPAEIMAQQWVPVTEETMPKEPYGCLLIVWDTPYDGGDEYLAYYPGFAGWDGTQWNDGDGQQVPFEVAYWMQLPPMPQTPKEEHNG